MRSKPLPPCGEMIERGLPRPVPERTDGVPKDLRVDRIKAVAAKGGGRVSRQPEACRSRVYVRPSCSQCRRLGLALDRRQRIALDPGFETAQALVDRDQLDDGAPRVDQILERGSDLIERV